MHAQGVTALQQRGHRCRKKGVEPGLATCDSPSKGHPGGLHAADDLRVFAADDELGAVATGFLDGSERGKCAVSFLRGEDVQLAQVPVNVRKAALECREKGGEATLGLNASVLSSMPVVV